MKDQPLFDFEARGRRSAVSPATAAVDRPPVLLPVPARGGLRVAIRRAVLRWLEASLPPTGLAVQVPTRRRNYQADVAAFWGDTVRNAGRGPGRLLVPNSTMVVECYTERDECWVDCTRAAEILPVLEEKRRVRAELEAAIREQEPELRSPEALFEELAEWEYDRSANPAYRQVRRDIVDLEAALHEGTTFEQIRKAEVADLLYAAVPAGLVRPDELADGWGLLWVHDDLRVTVERESKRHEVPVANRMHLVQTITAAAKAAVLAVNGIYRRAEDGDVHFVKQPKLHRRRVELRRP